MDRATTHGYSQVGAGLTLKKGVNMQGPSDTDLKKFEERFSKTNKDMPAKKVFTIKKGMELGVGGSAYRCTAFNPKTGKVTLKYLRADPNAL